MGLFGRDDYIDEDNDVKEDKKEVSLANDSAFDAIKVPCVNGDKTLGELKKSYDFVKYLPINAATGLLLFISGKKGITYTSCECELKFAHQLRPLWKNRDFYFYTEDKKQNYDDYD